MFRKMWLFPTLLFLLSIVVFSFTPAGANAKTIQKNPQTILSTPGDENWIPGFFSGLDNLEQVEITHVAIDSNGRLYLAGRFVMAGTHQQVSLVYRHNNQWMPLPLPAPFTDASRVRVGKMESDNFSNVYIYVTHPSGDRTLFVWNGSTWGDLNLVSNHSWFLGLDALAIPYIVDYLGNDGTIKKWDGAGWAHFADVKRVSLQLDSTETGRPPTPDPVRVDAITADTQGNLYFGGAFTHVNNVPATNLAKWDGSSWSAVGTGINPIYALATASNGLVFAGGVNSLGYVHNGTWHPFSFGGTVMTMKADSLGNVYIGGMFGLINNEPMTLVAQWNGTNWTNMDWGFPDFGRGVSSLEVDSQNRVYAAGEIYKSRGQTINQLAVWDGLAWSPFGSLTGHGIEGSPQVSWNMSVKALASDTQGHIYAGGLFLRAGDISAYSIAQWNGVEWDSIGGGVGCVGGCSNGARYGRVLSLDVSNAGHLYVAGSFASVGNGIPARNIAKWDGTAWSALGSLTFGSYDFVESIVVDDQENVYITYHNDELEVNEVKKWDGATWSTIGSGTTDYMFDLSIDNNGTLYKAGSGGVIYYWNNSDWIPVSAPLIGGGVKKIIFDKNNNLFVIGIFGLGGLVEHVLRFDGTNWVALGEGSDVSYTIYDYINDGVFDNAGYLYVTGQFSSNGISNIARWNGVEWSGLGAGLTKAGLNEGNALLLNSEGNLVVGGEFTNAGSTNSSNFAVWVAGDGACGLGNGGAHTLYAGEHEVMVEVTTAGTLDCLSLQRHQANHPAATPEQQVGSWWEMRAVDANGEPATGFTVNLTFPSAFSPISAEGKLCLQTDTGWDCAADAVNGRLVTRQGVTSLGTITIEANLFYQFIPVILR